MENKEHLKSLVLNIKSLIHTIEDDLTLAYYNEREWNFDSVYHGAEKLMGACEAYMYEYENPTPKTQEELDREARDRAMEVLK